MQWAIWIQSTQWNKKPPIAQVRQTFESMGFRLRDQKFDYYNPTRHSRFIAEHAKPSAITVWTLAWANHWPNTRIEINNHDH